jgi:hypothetical protein
MTASGWLVLSPARLCQPLCPLKINGLQFRVRLARLLRDRQQDFDNHYTCLKSMTYKKVSDLPVSVVVVELLVRALEPLAPRLSDAFVFGSTGEGEVGLGLVGDVDLFGAPGHARAALVVMVTCGQRRFSIQCTDATRHP